MTNNQLDMEQIKAAMFRNSKICSKHSLRCKAVFFIDESGETIELSMFSQHITELNDWWHGVVDTFDKNGTIYNTLTI